MADEAPILVLDGFGGERRALRGRLSLGRGRDNDWVLADPEGQVSRRHCVVERSGDQVVVVDQSRNGTFVNGESEPLGEGVKRRLRPGDRLRLGPFTLRLEGEGALAPAPPAQGRSIAFDDPAADPAPANPGADDLFDPTWLQQRGRLAAAHHPSRSAKPDERRFVPEPERAVVAFDWGDEPSKPPAAEEGMPQPPPTEDDPFGGDLAIEPPAEPDVEATPEGGKAAADLLVCFLEGAGLDPAKLSVEDRAAFMRLAGRQVRTLSDGLQELLVARAQLKSAVRAERTQFGIEGNNPLKVVRGPEEALHALLVPQGRGWLDPEQALDAGLADLRAHELAMLEGMQSALGGLLARFSPERFEAELDEASLLARLAAGGRKARCWELFKERYGQITAEAKQRFLGEVGLDFAAAYDKRARRNQ